MAKATKKTPKRAANISHNIMKASEDIKPAINEAVLDNFRIEIFNNITNKTVRIFKLMASQQRTLIYKKEFSPEKNYEELRAMANECIKDYFLKEK